MSLFGVFLVRIQPKGGKIRTRKTPNKDTFHGVLLLSKHVHKFFFLGFSWKDVHANKPNPVLCEILFVCNKPIKQILKTLWQVFLSQHCSVEIKKHFNKEPCIYDFQTEREWVRVLKFGTSLQILFFLNKIFIALFSDGEREITSLVIFCGCLKYMTSNDKKSMDMILKLCMG